MSVGALNPNLAKSFFEKESKLWVRRYESRSYRERRELVLSMVQEEVRKSGGKCLQVLDFAAEQAA